MKITDEMIINYLDGELNISDKEFFSRKEFEYYIKNASHVMTHGGAGTLLQLAKIKKMPLYKSFFATNIICGL